MKTISLLLLLIFACCKNSFCQCEDYPSARDGFYDRVSPAEHEDIYNEPWYGFNQCKSFNISGGNSYLTFDNRLNNPRFPLLFENENYEWITRYDSINRMDSVFLLDRATATEKLFSVSRNYPPCPVFHFNNFSANVNYDGINVFNHQNNEIINYKISAGEIGYDDTTIYSRLFEKKIKWNDEKYVRGDIVSVTPGGLSYSKNNFPEREANTHAGFINKDYSVFDSYQRGTGVINDWLLHLRIYFQNNLIDSFIQKDSYENFWYEKDTLVISGNDYFRKYVHGKLTGKWVRNEWKDFNPLICRLTIWNLYNTGKYFFVRVSADTTYKNGILFIDGNRFTMNHYPINSTSNKYSVILLFDIEKNIFLGYPEIQFLNY